MIKKIRNKVTEKEAVLFTGPETYKDLPEEYKEAMIQAPNLGPHPSGQFYIKTLEGKMKVSSGDWIVKGLNGEFYPVKPDIFEKSYDII